MRLVWPKNYDITFEPDFKNFTFNGKERISIDIAKPTNKFVLNSAEIKIKVKAIQDGEWKIEAKTNEVSIPIYNKVSEKETAYVLVEEDSIKVSESSFDSRK